MKSGGLSPQFTKASQRRCMAKGQLAGRGSAGLAATVCHPTACIGQRRGHSSWRGVAERSLDGLSAPSTQISFRDGLLALTAQNGGWPVGCPPALGGGSVSLGRWRQVSGGGRACHLLAQQPTLQAAWMFGSQVSPGNFGSQHAWRGELYLLEAL